MLIINGLNENDHSFVEVINRMTIAETLKIQKIINQEIESLILKRTFNVETFIWFYKLRKEKTNKKFEFDRSYYRENLLNQ
jgi:hypothetical protein